jgi:AraC-like DNA-binding protein/mannose-6-phosphate isomerase-like protein (cupin superfamily)
MFPESSGEKRGFLQGDFAFFHLKDQKNTPFEYHYHEFSKIIIFVSGQVSYLIEGKAYRLKPWDILLVSSKEIHKPVIDPFEPYERIVIWVNPEFMEKHSTADSNLQQCFETAASERYNLLRSTPDFMKSFRGILSQLDEACKSSEFGSRILKNALFIQLIVFLNRQLLGSAVETAASDIEYDENIGTILDYINQNLNGDLSIETLASRFFMSRYYLMHRFKNQTGYSIHSYVLQKRLIHASSLIRMGQPVHEVCMDCGFGDYSNFIRSYKKMFGQAPKKHYRSLLEGKKQKNREQHM